VEIEFLRERLGAYEPDQVGSTAESHAAVALVFRQGPTSVEVLLIERAEREGDPWSGHMAFPGGRLEQEDESTQSAAQRETLEEVGIELGEAEYLGQLNDLVGNRRLRPSLVVAAHVFYLDDRQSFDLDPKEVQSAFWFPLTEMLEKSRCVDFKISDDSKKRFPGILVGVPERHVVWGMTYRFLEDLLAILGQSLPKPSRGS
jgi:8-oxo-dGTP pyrophosphatase MutT (NUDIX family)